MQFIESISNGFKRGNCEFELYRDNWINQINWITKPWHAHGWRELQLTIYNYKYKYSDYGRAWQDRFFSILVCYYFNCLTHGLPTRVIACWNWVYVSTNRKCTWTFKVLSLILAPDSKFSYFHDKIRNLSWTKAINIKMYYIWWDSLTLERFVTYWYRTK